MRAAYLSVRSSASTHAVARFSRPEGLPLCGHLRAHAAQPYAQIRFSPPEPASAAHKGNADRREYEKGGLVLPSVNNDPFDGPDRFARLGAARGAMPAHRASDATTSDGPIWSTEGRLPLASDSHAIRLWYAGTTVRNAQLSEIK